MTFRRISGEICVTSSRIFCLRSSIVLSVVWYTLLLIYLHRKKSQAVKSGERGGHGIFPFREIIRLGNKSFRIFILILAVWLVAPSCWKNPVTPYWTIYRIKKCCNICEFTVTASPRSFSKKYGPMILEEDKLGFVSLQYLKFCLLTYSEPRHSSIIYGPYLHFH
jgi:hypothetical protein